MECDIKLNGNYELAFSFGGVWPTTKRITRAFCTVSENLCGIEGSLGIGLAWSIKRDEPARQIFWPPGWFAVSDLFSWFQSYLNLSKITAVTVPGMVVAFALILVLGPIPCRDNKDCPFCPTTPKPVSSDPGTKASESVGSSGEAKFIEGTKDRQSVKPLQSVLDKLPKPAPQEVVYAPPAACASLPTHLLDGSIQSRKIDYPLDPELDESVDLSKLEPDLESCADWLKTTSASVADHLKLAASADKSKYQAAATALTKFQSSVLGLQKIAGGAPANITWVQVSQDSLQKELLPQGIDNLLTSAGAMPIGDSCNAVPRFFAANSLTALGPYPTDDDVSKANAAAAKKAQRLVQLGTVVAALNICGNKLQTISAGLATASSSLAQLITQDTTNLQTLSNNLITAQQGGETLVAEKIRRSLETDRATLDHLERQQAALKAATTAVSNLQSRVSGMITPANAPVASAPSTSNAAVDVFQTIEQNLLKFLLFSLILGQILDPIQRGAVAFIGPRRRLFSSLNRVYGQNGDGEFRYGERRVWPWVSDPGDIVSVDAHNESELRPNDAGRKFGESRSFVLSDRNVYDKNYAVGAGFITAKEASSIDDEYYAQSQITSGLIIPLFILSTCVAIRIICCSAAAAASGTYQRNTLLALSAISFGAFFGLILMFFVLMMTSGSYWSAVTSGIRYFWLEMCELVRFRPTTSEGSFTPGGGSFTRLRLATFLMVGLFFSACWIVTIWFLVKQGADASSAYLDYSSLLLIISPTLLVGPLWIAGLDRLHKYYSELEARIAGNILRLNSNTEKKIVDLLSDPVGSKKLKDSLQIAFASKQNLEEFLKGIHPDTDSQ